MQDVLKTFHGPFIRLYVNMSGTDIVLEEHMKQQCNHSRIACVQRLSQMQNHDYSTAKIG